MTHLSELTQPDRPDELGRIEKAGGRVIYWDGARVLGVLAMSRAIGIINTSTLILTLPRVAIIVILMTWSISFGLLRN